MKLRIHVIISGRVQGVWFRAGTRDKAQQLGLKGWVKNIQDGNVEAVFDGEEKLVKEMIEWCHHGPPLAEVENVEAKKEQSSDDFDDFYIKH